MLFNTSSCARVHCSAASNSTGTIYTVTLLLKLLLILILPLILILTDANTAIDTANATTIYTTNREDHPHDKHADTLLPTNTSNNSSGGDLPLAECFNLVFMGSLACSGHCTAVVTATGMHTEFGKVCIKGVLLQLLELA
jgi:hypothetical protein